jgi:predicted transcriptional regulator
MKILISIKPNYAEQIIKGTKKFEYRRNFVINPNLKKILIYVTSPVKKIVGEFVVNWQWILHEPPESLWKKTQLFSGIENKEVFDHYFSGCKLGYAIYVGKIVMYKKPKQLSDYGIKNAPQSYVYIKK